MTCKHVWQWVKGTADMKCMQCGKQVLQGEVLMDTYKLYEPPKPVGHWVLYAEASYTTSFAMYHKPSWIQRWFTNKLLGWTWKDAQ
jgi:hypothetical protein